MSIMVAIPNGLTVSENPDGTYAWSGSYEGATVKSAAPLNGGERWIILLDPDANQRSAFENLLCIDERGGLIWRAELPTSPDVFIAAGIDSEGVWGATWSGLRLRFDPKTGSEIGRVFAK